MILHSHSDTDQAPDAIHAVAVAEHTDPEELFHNVTSGSTVIMRREDRFVGIGKGLRIKVNVNIGTSNVHSFPEEEVKKAVIAERSGADTLSDLSMGERVGEIRRLIFEHTSIPITTVPVYQTAAEKGIEEMTARDILTTVRDQAREGVSSMVMHSITPGILELCRETKRTMGIVSKGGSITAAFMLQNDCQNPFLEYFDEILLIMKEHGVVLSLGNATRSGCIGDAWDAAQREELRTNIALAEKAHRAGVQVIIEGAGGHIRYDRIAPCIRHYKESSRFPLFVAGPLPTDIALGFDHIAGCVGASAAGAAGADYLCCITPAEHLGLPTPEQVREGLIAWRIAAHIGDLARYGMDIPDSKMARRRALMDRRGQLALAMDPDIARENGGDGDMCTMCGDFCALRLMRHYLKNPRP
ncbi:MAG: phosphomethylpyrimidine synthase ThiC [Methanolinea sp.]|nr:phosphomethylpyrimidine synthase ThiC [Methanolinea sp.]